MKVLITGGAGFIGSHLSERLLELGEKVFVIDNLSTGSKENIESIITHHDFEFIQGDIRDIKILEPLIVKSDVIFNLTPTAAAK